MDPEALDLPITVNLTDMVRVHFVHGMREQPGILFGQWYVTTCNPAQRDRLPIWGHGDGGYAVGHHGSGRAAACGLSFWEAYRVARAMGDADPDIGNGGVDWDVVYLIEAVIGSAMMDHYVFPLSCWEMS